MACVNGVQERRQGRVSYFNNAVFSPSLLTRKKAKEKRTLVIRPDFVSYAEGRTRFSMLSLLRCC
jgi:hypothetical protein